MEFGPIDELMKKCGALRELEDMPSGTITKPAAVFKPRDPKKQIVGWDAHRSLELWQKRDTCLPNSLPDVFEEPSITEVPTGFVGRNKLVLKAKDCVELMYYTTDDE